MTATPVGPVGFRSTIGTASALDLSRHVRQLLRKEIDFVPNARFPRMRQREAEELLADLETEDRTIGTGKLPRDLPGHLARLCESPLLTAEQERELFRRMNFLKFRANVIRSRLNPQAPDESAIDCFECLMAGALMLRDRIIRANLRLVMAVVKKFVTPRHSFDDALSDGLHSLMQAVEKFDFDRGFRFSTYAYRAIARNAYRKVTDLQRDASRFVTGSDEAMQEAADESRAAGSLEQAWDELHDALQVMLRRLDRRERFIIRGRYALGGHRESHTFQSLADKLGISKERVRQLEQRAVGKLRDMARQVARPELFETVFDSVEDE